MPKGPTGKPKGRPRYQATEADRATVKNLVAAGVPEERICNCLGTDGIDHETMRKHFRHELKTARDSVTAFAMSGVVRGIQNGEEWAIRTWLKCRAGWSETQKNEVSGPDGQPFTGVIQVVISPDDAKL